MTHSFDGLIGNPDSSQFQMRDEFISGLRSNTLKEMSIIGDMTEKQMNNISFTWENL